MPQHSETVPPQADTVPRLIDVRVPAEVGIEQPAGRAFSSALRGVISARRLAKRTVAVVIALAGICVIWQLICVLGHVSQLLLPTPGSVASTLVSKRDLLWRNAGPTLLEAVVGFGLAVLIGAPFGYLISLPSRVQAFLTTSMLSAQIFPKIAVAPLFIVWFGFGMGPKFLFIFLMTFFPITMNAQAGFASLPNEIRELGRIVGLSRWGRLRKLELPWSLPYLFTGLKISGSFTVIGAIVYEFVGSNSGLGHLILSSSTNLNSTTMFAAFIVVTLLGFLFYGAVAAMEVFVIPWHISRRNVR